MARVSAEMEVLIQQTEDLIAENARTAQDQTGYPMFSLTLSDQIEQDLRRQREIAKQQHEIAKQQIAEDVG